MKAQHFHTKLLYQKLMLRQIEWGVLKEPIAKNGLIAKMPLTTSLFENLI